MIKLGKQGGVPTIVISKDMADTMPNEKTEIELKAYPFMNKFMPV